MNHSMKLVSVEKVSTQTYYLFRCVHCQTAYYIARVRLWLSPQYGEKTARMGPCRGNIRERRHLRYDP